MIILNLTQHPASAEQAEAGVISCKNQKELKELLNFSEIPSKAEVSRTATMLAGLASMELKEPEKGTCSAMIGGAPYLMSALVAELKTQGITPLCSYTQRVSVEETQKDGSVVKKSIFRHEGWVQC